MFYTYVLKSQKDGSYYIGSTNNLESRIIKHNKGGSRFTKNKIPFILIYNETYNTLSQAREREKYMKSLKSRKAIEKIINRAPFV